MCPASALVVGNKQVGGTWEAETVSSLRGDRGAGWLAGTFPALELVAGPTERAYVVACIVGACRSRLMNECVTERMNERSV